MSRFIFYSEDTKEFTEGFDVIENIYREINPNFIYLLLKTKRELTVRDNKGIRTELMILPF